VDPPGNLSRDRGVKPTPPRRGRDTRATARAGLRTGPRLRTWFSRQNRASVPTGSVLALRSMQNSRRTRSSFWIHPPPRSGVNAPVSGFSSVLARAKSSSLAQVAAWATMQQPRLSAAEFCFDAIASSRAPSTRSDAALDSARTRVFDLVT